MFSSHCNQRYPHSFPTRRSSDLGGAPGRRPGDARGRGVGRRIRAARAARIRRPTRSEEHTSELQSRQYLVCRLLLEKKKIERLFRREGDQRRSKHEKSERLASKT